MKFIKLSLKEEVIAVNKFENETDKLYPYYQNGRKYALCPTCGSSVQIIGGENNITQQSRRNAYAAHTSRKICGLNYNEISRNNCLNYEKNKNNWQKIYEQSVDSKKNSDVEKYIESNKNQIATEIENISGFKCVFKNETGKLFNSLYKSFKENGGLYIPKNKFVPEYISRLIIEKAIPIRCWGYIPTDKTKKIILRNKDLANELYDNGQFKPTFDVELTGTLDDDVAPKYIILKLLYKNGKKETINKISARI